ncbi:MAG: hypothetical protein C4537_07730 [Acholeplasma sp.]|nr:MAG: hypothetical protein C4537_07730 [Acholeplasma sp.]
MKKQKIKIIFILITLNIIFSMGMTFAYWASSVFGNQDDGSSAIDIGFWGIPIYTAQEFYDFATKTNSVATDLYYLHNDIDFTGFTWTYNASNYNVTFRGTLNGNGKKLSNLTITNNSTSYLYNGIFPRGNGASVYDLTLENVNTITNLSGTSQRSGLLFGNVWGGTNNISNIKVIDSSSQGNSTNGVGGLVGNVQNSTTILNLSQIKATNLRVFNDTSYVGGLVGRIATSGGRVNMTDIDFEGDVYANIVTNTGASYAGGLIGFVRSGAIFSVERAVVEATFQNTLVTASNYLVYSNRYLGGIMGYNASATANVTLNTVYVTGSLYTRIDTTRNDVGTVSGRDATQASLTNVYHAYVAYRSVGGGVNYTATTQTGQMSTLVSASTPPSQAQYDTFYAWLVAGNPFWQQDLNGRPFLDI